MVSFLAACGQAEPYSSGDDSSHKEECLSCDEQEINAPVDEDNGSLDLPSEQPAAEEPQDAAPSAVQKQVYFFPTFSSANGIAKSLWEKAQKYYDQHWKTFENNRYVVIVNLGLSAAKKRFWLVDLKTGKVVGYHTSHGSGSDPNGDGIATSFSNVPGSKKSSLGAYETIGTYNGKHGRSLRLQGLDSTNNNAFSRAIVVHAANYVSEKQNWAGRSQGCPALDPLYAQAIIDKIKGGALLMIGNVK